MVWLMVVLAAKSEGSEVRPLPGELAFSYSRCWLLRAFSASLCSRLYSAPPPHTAGSVLRMSGNGRTHPSGRAGLKQEEQ